MTLMQRRRALMGAKKERLPAEYQEVEWVQSDGDQYINTGFIPTQQSVVELDWELINAIKGDNSTLFGLSQTGKGGWQIRSGGAIFAGREPTSWTRIGSVPNGLISMRYGKVIVNGVEHLFTVTGFSTLTISLFLFGLSSDGRFNQNATIAMRCRRFTAYADMEQGVPTIDLVPCYRKTDGVVGMYDLVSGTFYTNSGTGAFTKGGNV